MTVNDLLVDTLRWIAFPIPFPCAISLLHVYFWFCVVMCCIFNAGAHPHYCTCVSGFLQFSFAYIVQVH